MSVRGVIGHERRVERRLGVGGGREGSPVPHQISRAQSGARLSGQDAESLEAWRRGPVGAEAGDHPSPWTVRSHAVLRRRCARGARRGPARHLGPRRPPRSSLQVRVVDDLDEAGHHRGRPPPGPAHPTGDRGAPPRRGGAAAASSATNDVAPRTASRAAMIPTQIAADVPSELPGGTADRMRNPTSMAPIVPASATAAGQQRVLGGRRGRDDLYAVVSQVESDQTGARLRPRSHRHTRAHRQAAHETVAGEPGVGPAAHVAHAHGDGDSDRSKQSGGYAALPISSTGDRTSARAARRSRAFASSR